MTYGARGSWALWPALALFLLLPAVSRQSVSAQRYHPAKAAAHHPEVGHVMERIMTLQGGLVVHVAPDRSRLQLYRDEVHPCSADQGWQVKAGVAHSGVCVCGKPASVGVEAQGTGAWQRVLCRACGKKERAAGVATLSLAQKCRRCTRPAIYGKLEDTASRVPSGEHVAHCKLHREEGEENVRTRSCSELGCRRVGLFITRSSGRSASVYSTRRMDDIFCSLHRKECSERTAGSKTQMCTHSGCDTTATFGVPSGKVDRCKRHRMTGMVDLRSPYCRVGGCSRHAIFGPASGSRAQTCTKHKDDAFIDLRRRTCQFPEGCARPALAFVARRHFDTSMCANHQHLPQSSLGSAGVRYGCEGEGGLGSGSHWSAGSEGSFAYCCFVDLLGRRMCSKRGLYERSGGGGERVCGEHREMRDSKRVIGPKCWVEGCSTIPTFGRFRGETPSRCSAHREQSDVDVVNAMCSATDHRGRGCDRRALWWPKSSGQQSKSLGGRCWHHRLEGDVRKGIPLCQGDGCDAPATHGEAWRPRRPVFCAGCAPEHMRPTSSLGRQEQAIRMPNPQRQQDPAARNHQGSGARPRHRL